MATVTAQEEGAPLAIGSVIGNAFGVMTGNPLTVFGIAFIFGALPQALINYFIQFDLAAERDAQIGMAAIYLLSVVAFVLCSALAQSALVRATSAYLDGRTALIGECIATGIAKVLPLIGATILLVLGFLLGFLLFVIPGIILLLMWAVTIPALVEEDVGALEAFGRSRYLTKGSRWRIWFLMIIVAVITWLLSALTAIPGIIAGVNDASGPTASLGAIAIAALTSTLATALWSTMITALYFALRERREGLRSDRLADVFA